MSVDATRWAWKQKVKGNYKIILLSLADRANENHVCYPSLERLKNDCCLDIKTIKTGIKFLIENGFILKETATGKSNRYTLIGVENRYNPSPKTDHVTQPKNGPSPKTDLVQKRTDTQPKNGPPPSPKTDHEPKKNLKENLTIYGSEIFERLSVKENLNRKQQISLKPEDVNCDVWECYLNVRKKKGASSSVLAFKKLIHEIDECPRHGISRQEAIELSAEKGWKGVNWEWCQRKLPTQNENSAQDWT